MGSLEDALRKSGLVSKKQAKQARHQKRVHRSEVGREGLEAERLETENAHREQLEKRKEVDRGLEAERAQEQAAERDRLSPRRESRGTGASGESGASGQGGGSREPATLSTIGDQIYRGILGRTGGPKQYFFVLEGGQIRHVEVNDDTFRRLQDGGAGIVVAPTPDGESAGPVRFVIVDRSTALEVRSLIPECLLELQSERTFGDRR